MKTVITFTDHALNVGHLLIDMLHDTDARPCREQLDTAYQGGWRPIAKFKREPGTNRIKFPGDPPLDPILVILMRGERVYLYPCDLVAIVQPDESIEVARMS